MGRLIDGKWRDDDMDIIKNGAFVRARQGEPFASREEILTAFVEGDDLLLIASPSCPWSHGVVLVRALKGLTANLKLSPAGGPRAEGYRMLRPAEAGLSADAPHIHRLYTATDPHFSGRVTVPLLWHRGKERILLNSSDQLMQVLDLVPAGCDFTLRPPSLSDQIDKFNADLKRGLSNAVYEAGLAQSQAAYETAVGKVFETLDRLEERLAASRFLFNSGLTLSDLRLFAVLVRFDLVYATHFRCTRRRLVDYPNLWAYARDLHSWPQIATTVDREAILEGYYLNDGVHNPHAIIADLPDADWDRPHERGRLGSICLHNRDGSAIQLSGATPFHR